MEFRWRHVQHQIARPRLMPRDYLDPPLFVTSIPRLSALLSGWTRLHASAMMGPVTSRTETVCALP